MTRYVIDAAGLSDRGIKRDHNEDSWSSPLPDLSAEQIKAKGQLYVVADGVGGHLAGDVASAMAVDIIEQHYYNDPSPDIVVSLKAAIEAANKAIYQNANDDPARRGMGTTLTAATLQDRTLTVANVGDSRTYLIRESHARQLTTDHTWVEEQVKVGLITREQAARHPQRNIITRSLGNDAQLDIDIFKEHVGAGDSVLLCSDGLSNVVSKTEIGDIVNQGPNAQSSVQKLVELTKQRGAPDNVTAVLLNLKPAKGGLARPFVALGIIGVLLLALGIPALYFMFGQEKNDTTTAPGLVLESKAPTFTASFTPPTRPTSPPDTPTPTPLPLDASLPMPELVWPNADATLATSNPITFEWKWEQTLQEEDWQFVFALKPGQDAPALIQRELPLSQRRLALPQTLAPGEYWWSLSIKSTYRRGEATERRLAVRD
jgi:serine/threonine protein phosphatase PrpC